MSESYNKQTRVKNYTFQPVTSKTGSMYAMAVYENESSETLSKLATLGLRLTPKNERMVHIIDRLVNFTDEPLTWTPEEDDLTKLCKYIVGRVLKYSPLEDRELENER